MAPDHTGNEVIQPPFHDGRGGPSDLPTRQCPGTVAHMNGKWTDEEQRHWFCFGLRDASPFTDTKYVPEMDTAYIPRVEEPDPYSRPPQLTSFGQTFTFNKTTEPVFGIHDGDGRSLLEFRLKDGVVEARYYDTDLDAAAKFFVEYLYGLKADE